MSHSEPRHCTLRRIARAEAVVCPEERCSFWEPGGAVVKGNCVVERLGIGADDADVAAYLLEALERLEQAQDLAEAEQAHREFAHRLGRDV